VVFLDPPWGGPEYNKKDRVELFLSEINVVDLCVNLLSQHKASLIVLKVPANYHLQDLVDRLPTKNIMTHKIYRGLHHSYNVIFCWG
jgi:hypothetical protein